MSRTSRKTARYFNPNFLHTASFAPRLNIGQLHFSRWPIVWLLWSFILILLEKQSDIHWTEGRRRHSGWCSSTNSDAVTIYSDAVTTCSDAVTSCCREVWCNNLMQRNVLGARELWCNTHFMRFAVLWCRNHSVGPLRSPTVRLQRVIVEKKGATLLP